MAALSELRGKDLACWCAPERYHAEVLRPGERIGRLPVALVAEERSRDNPVWPAFRQQANAAIEAAEPWEGLFDGTIRAPNPRHSQKPEVFADHISRLWPNTPKLEMFARKPRDGWDSWGNEV